jgi:hypothetical protein
MAEIDQLKPPLISIEFHVPCDGDRTAWGVDIASALLLRSHSLVGVQELLRFSGGLEIMNLLRLGDHTSTLHFAGILCSTILLLES